jgi:hypothetical protein
MSYFKGLIVLFTFIILFLITNFEVKATCPAWATNNQIYNFTINDCVYEAQICWKCPITLGQEWITVDYFKSLDQSCDPGITPRQVLNAIFAQINTGAWLWGLCNGFPPCPTQYPYHLINYNCWYEYNNAGTYEYYVCNYDSWCQEDWTICWDNILGPIKTLVNSWYSQGTIDCPTFWPGNPPPGYSSTCWLFVTCP